MGSDRELHLNDLDQPSPPPGYGDEVKEFPLPWLPEDLALRDYFAAHALGGLLAGRHIEKTDPFTPRSTKAVIAAEAAYQLADAMLRARQG